MRKISAFNFLTLNGYYKALNDDISWHVHGEEGEKFSEEQLSAGNILLFGRKTFEMMYSFWPTPMAYESFPKVADSMNGAEKIVLSNSLSEAEWQNTTVLSGDVISQLRQIKSSSGKNITILGSGTVVTQLTDAGLIDEYEFLIDPVVIGKGFSIFENLKQTLSLTLVDTMIFSKKGSILLRYKRSAEIL